MNTPRDGWLVGGASVRGASHARNGKPNQDAVAWAPPNGAGASVAAAVSDGHGAQTHFRSEVGARLAVQQAIAALTRPGVEELEEELAGLILTEWRRSVDAHAAANPFDRGDPPPSEGARHSAYGATLLAFAADDDALTALQIGDGDLLLGYPDGAIRRPLPDDHGLVGEETYSLCQDNALSRFRIASQWRDREGAWPDFVMLCTDGVSKSYRDEAAFLEAATRLRELAHADWPTLTSTLPGWLDQLTANGSGDDCTLCIARRAPA